MKIETNKLDNPVWNSLNDIHVSYALNYGDIHFYYPEYCPFGGFTSNATEKGISEYSKLIKDFYIVGEKPETPNSISVHQNLVCNQMLVENSIDIEIKEQIVELKTESQKSQLSNLVNFVQPGYFKNKTSELGRYYGIYKDNQLIAAAGERMKMNGFTEISAVVTHPKHTRKGYAKQLIIRTTDQIFKDNKIPYLHVAEANSGAIKLYEKLGFYTRRKISFWHIKA